MFSIQAIAFSVFRDRGSEMELQGGAEEKLWPRLRRRRRSGAEEKATPKMGCPRCTEASGGGGAAREAPWRRGEGERRPAVGTNGGDGARVE